MKYEIYSGIQKKALRVLIYGVEGVGKTTLASHFPDPVFIDCEGGSDNLNVKRFPRPTSWQMLVDEVRDVLNDPTICRTLVIDTIDWAEAQCINYIVSKNSNVPQDGSENSIEKFGWGKGYVILHEEMGRFLNLLNEVRDKGVNVVLLGHMQIRTVTLPDDQGSYDRYELKLKTNKNANVCQLVKEWADMVLFLNYQQFVVEEQKSKKNKVTGGSRRVMYTNHTAAWDAKNRYDLPEMLPLDFGSIAHLFADQQAPAPEPVKPKPQPKPKPAPAPEPVKAPEPENPLTTVWAPKALSKEEEVEMAKYPQALRDLMMANYVHPGEIQNVVASKGYYPAYVPISSYDPDFVQGVLISAWDKVLESIEKDRTLPF